MKGEAPMNRFRPAPCFTILLAALITFGWLAVPDRAPGARPYEGTTIRAVVNAEYVKYSLTLVEKDLYDTLGVKLETEVIPADAFVAKTLLELNSGSSPGAQNMFGPSNMPAYDPHFQPPDASIEKMKLNFHRDHIVHE